MPLSECSSNSQLWKLCFRWVYVIIISSSHVTGCMCMCVFFRWSMGVLVFTWQPTRKGSDAGGSGGARAADITPLQREKENDRQKQREREREEWTRNSGLGRKTTDGWKSETATKKTNRRSLSSFFCRLQDGCPTPATTSTVNKCKHAVKVSQCLCRMGKCTFDYEMCLPSAAYKSSVTGFVCPECSLRKHAVIAFHSHQLSVQTGTEPNFIGC